MQTIAIVLVILSAAMHAGRNYLTKKAADKQAFVWWYEVVGLLLFTPLFSVYFPTTSLAAMDVWGFIAISGLLHFVHFRILFDSGGLHHRSGELHCGASAAEHCFCGASWRLRLEGEIPQHSPDLCLHYLRRYLSDCDGIKKDRSGRAKPKRSLLYPSFKALSPVTNRMVHRRWAVSWIPIRATSI